MQFGRLCGTSVSASLLKQLNDSDMEVIYENLKVTKSDHWRPQSPQTVPQDSKTGLYGAVLFLGLICASLLIGIIVLGVYYIEAVRGSAAELSSIKANLTEHLQTTHNQTSNLTKETDWLNASFIGVTQEPEILQNLSTSGPPPEIWKVFKDRCYLFSSRTGTWETARQDCRNRGAYLVIINSTDEQSFISRSKRSSWIGLNDLENEGTWKWVDGSPVTLKFWDGRQPDNGDGEQEWGEEDCVHISITGLWNDLSCTNLFQWICETKCTD